MTFIIQTQQLFKTYTDRNSSVETKALDDINLNIAEKDFVAIAGPSGSGKTTLLNILGGLDEPTSGDIIVDNQNFASLGKAALADFRLKKIGFVFQAYNLISTLTTLENTEYVALLQGIPEIQRRKESFEVLKDLGLGPLIHRRPTELSAGQQQRVAIARAILVKPKIILADEPTANLDSKTGAGLIDLMYNMNQTLGITFVFATHDKMVMEKAKNLIQLHDGKII